MGINTDYSVLFGNMSTSAQTSSTSGFSLLDYASIKNGSYAKLLKAYYKKDTSEKTVAEKKDIVSDLEQISAQISAFTKAADKLIAKGDKSLFNKVEKTETDDKGNSTTTKEYDKDAIYKAASDFVKTYNDFINKAKKSTNSNVAREADSLANYVTYNSKLLAKAGITINDDDTLSINEDDFKKADMETVKSIFNGNQSLAYSMSSKAAMIGATSKTAANSAKGYTNSGTYYDSYSTGSILNSIV